MNSGSISEKSTPHLTPEKLVGRQFASDTFEDIKVALVGFCPRPGRLNDYKPQDASEQFFIHLPPASVQTGHHKGRRFLSMSHVYGGPVASAMIEELAYYGIEYVLAYGLAGGLGTRDLKMADFYLVEKALAMDGTTPHYTDATLIPSDAGLNARIMELAALARLPELTPVQAVTSDAIYREYDQELDDARERGCDIVNCDSAHLFAVSREVGIRTTQCGVISDVTSGAGEEWDSDLAVMLSGGSEEAGDPLSRVGELVKFYVETLMPELVRE